MTPERVAHAEFRSAFRGLDSTEVRAFLARTAGELRSLLQREAELLERLRVAEERKTVLASGPLDVHQVSELLGPEVALVLTTAHEQAVAITARAKADAAAVSEASVAEAAQLRGLAEAVLTERTAAAETAATAIRDQAEANARAGIAAAEQAAELIERNAAAAAAVLAAEADELKARAAADALAAREAARDEGRRMVAEARAVRERILTDMARRRNVARQQLERVRAARERLLEGIDGVRQSVAEVQADLAGSLVEAKLAAERAARSVDVDTIPTMVDLDAEVEMAKDAGLVDVNALLARDEDLSALDTGEFAAVTVIEPEVVGPVVPVVADIDGEGELDASPSEPGADEVPSGPGAADVEVQAKPAAGAAKAPKAAKAPNTRKARGPQKTEQLFARLRATDGTGSALEAGTVLSGAAVVVGAAAPASAGDVAGEPTAPLPEVGVLSEEPVPADPAEAANPNRVTLQLRDALLAPTVRDLNRQLKLAFSDQQNQLLEASRNAEGKDPARAPSAQEMAALYVAAGRDDLAAAFLVGRRSVRPGDKTTPGSVNVDAQTVELAEAVVTALRLRLSAGNEDGDGDEELWSTDRVRSVYREVRSRRLGELIDFEVFSAYAAGQLAAAPKGALARWVCDGCGPDCLDNALAGPQPFGIIYPTGHAAPPAFSGCRCTLALVEGS